MGDTQKIFGVESGEVGAVVDGGGGNGGIGEGELVVSHDCAS